MKIINMTRLDKTQITQAAQILTDSIPIAWPTLQHALDEIKGLLIPENTLLAAVENEIVVGWGGILAPFITEMFLNYIHWLFVVISETKVLAEQS